MNFANPYKNIAPLPGIVSPKLAAKIRNAVRSQQINQDWRNWETWNSAIASSSNTQNLAWNSFEQYRLLINNHKTFTHMRVWESALNTGEESRYLWDIAGKDTLILAPRESAKAQPLTELVLKPNGYCYMGDLRVGDEIFAGDGTLTQIIKITPQGIKPNYQVTFDNGAIAQCSLDHLWQVLDSKDNRIKVLPLSNLFDFVGRRYLIPFFGVDNAYDVAIAKIEYVGDVEMQCITVAHPSGLYVTNDYIVTHNSTYLAQWVSYQFGMHTSPWRRLALKCLGVSYNIDTAMPRSRQIQSIMESSRYQEIFPWVRPSKKKWGEKEWMIDLEWAGLATTEEQYSYVCAGLTGAINSRRCHLVLLDDLIKSPEAIRAQSVRGAMVSNWENVIQFTRYDGSRAVCLGTRMTADDIYCTTFLKEKGWNVIEQSALLEHPDGTEYSFWEPEDDKAPGIPLRRLQEERETTPIAFAFQRQNKIVRVKEQSLSPDLIVRGILPTQFSHLVLGVDLSAGLKESNDYTAFVLGGVLIEGEVFSYWIIDAWEDRIMGNTPKLDAMIEVWDSWKHLLPQTRRYNPASEDWDLSPVLGLELWFDSSAYGLSLQGDYEDHIIKRNHILDWHVKPVPASGRGGKLERLRRHTGLFHNHLIKFNMYGRTMADGRKPLGRLIQQITEFGSTSHDDLGDAFELCVSGMRSHLPLTKGNY
ncbi:MAG: hypothetical protein KME54_28915 [Tolypothrix brevis GSE-NOS-MK-07-07A]|nr:hypothetical protein [Tolypothrix brevis GSE-NOS-MK-07-07A]